MRRQRFVAGVLDWTPDLPTQIWSPVVGTEGQTLITATGVGDGERVTESALVSLALRVWESEWYLAEDLIRYGLACQPIQWYPDAATTLFHIVWLESPSAGEAWSPQRLAGYSRVLTMDLTFRGAFGAVPWSEFFA